MDERPFTAASFEQFLGEHKFMASKCKHCGKVWCPPRPLCASCHGTEMEWVEMKGRGTLVAFTTIGVGTPMMIEQGYGRDNPYCSGVVELEEGPKISAQILGVDAHKPEDIKIGTPVQTDFLERGTWSFTEELAKVRKTYLAFRVQ